MFTPGQGIYVLLFALFAILQIHFVNIIYNIIKACGNDHYLQVSLYLAELFKKN